MNLLYCSLFVIFVLISAINAQDSGLYQVEVISVASREPEKNSTCFLQANLKAKNGNINGNITFTRPAISYGIAVVEVLTETPLEGNLNACNTPKNSKSPYSWFSNPAPPCPIPAGAVALLRNEKVYVSSADMASDIAVTLEYEVLFLDRLEICRFEIMGMTREMK